MNEALFLFTVAISMLHETLSMQNYHNVNMSLYKARISCTSIHLMCIVCMIATEIPSNLTPHQPYRYGITKEKNAEDEPEGTMTKSRTKRIVIIVSRINYLYSIKNRTNTRISELFRSRDH